MKIELSSIVENQLPLYVREEYPLAAEFLKQYYISDNANKIVQNIDEYLDLDVIFDIPESTILLNSIDFDDDVINVSSTKGSPETYGLLKIDNEIITYISKTDTSFNGCIRGFSAVERAASSQLVFTDSNAAIHNSESKVYNLSSFFLKEFFFKIKQKIAPGFENRNLYSSLNQANFLKHLKDFYQSKGTEESFRLLFAALYGTDVKLILPRDRLFSASNAQYRVTKKLVVEALQGNPKELVNGTIYQDSDGFIPEARGTITYIEQIIRNNKPYFVISLDYDYDKDIDVSGSLKSEFTVHPQTLTLSVSTSNSSFIDVDSTVGFPDSGTLITKNEDGTDLVIQYTSKSLNQFLGCSGITSEIKQGSSVRFDSFAYGYNSNQEIVKLRVTGVLDEPQFIDDTNSYNPKEEFEIETLGFPSVDLRANDWKFNIPLTYNIASIELLDFSDLSYKVETIDNCVFSVGDNCVLVPPSSIENPGTVSNILNNNTIVASFDSPVNLEQTHVLKKIITKTRFQDAPELDIYNANVQNTYLDSDKNVYVLSPSLPSYLFAELTTNTGKITFSGTFNNQIDLPTDHPFFTGDIIVYRPDSSTNKLLDEGIYFIKKVDEKTIKLALSRENLYNQTYVEFSGSVTNSTLEFFEFTGLNLAPKSIQPQNLIRKLVTPRLSSQRNETTLSAVGILKNGVEIMNYKSPHQIFYGPITKVVASAPGKDYDIINPPTLTLTDQSGSGALIHPAITGSLKRIDLVYSGFDYIDEPSITIKGGNGKNASAKANLIDFDHIEFFNANNVSLTQEIIGFSTYHKFRHGEEVVYNANGQPPVGGLISREKYFINVKNGIEVSLHKNQSDAISGISSINLTTKSTGLHSLKALNKKKKIGSISVLSEGENYKYRKNLITGINTSTGIIEVKDHKFESGELVFYYTSSTPSTGITNNTQYYVNVIDENHVTLAGINTIKSDDFNYLSGQYIGITSLSSSIQYLSYPPIEVELKGRIGVTTFDSTTFNSEIIPIFRGGIVDVTLESGGSSYGSQDILDYSIEPKITITKGSGAQLKPIINNGKIIGVIIQYAGSNYKSTPDVIVQGDGYNAILTPIIQNGIIVDVKIISGGFGYTTEKTFITINSSGEGAQFKTTIRSWRINNFEKLYKSNYFSEDDGVIANALNPNNGLQYYHLFAPRKLRSSTYSKNVLNGVTVFQKDLQVDQNNKEIDSTVHSPILGWAYDGNPIYGPYGYASRFNSTSIKQLTSGYTLKTNLALENENRPDQNIYTVGLFVEDYEYTASGDLDEHNGRYCVTPEFPNGVYAYFTTFEDVASTSGAFANYKKPKFPYVIGNSYYSKAIDFNFDPKSNQSQVNFSDLGLLRNTLPYNLKSNNTNYEGLLLPYEVKKAIFTIKTVNPSNINKIDVLHGGDGYKVNDTIELESNNLAKISKIRGKSVTGVACSENFVENLELLSKNSELIAYSTTPHPFKDGDSLFFSSYDGKNTKQKVKIRENQLILSVGVQSSSITGIVTHFNVYGNLSEDDIKPNDIYKIGNEEIKILTVDNIGSRVWIERQYNGTSGINSFPVGFAFTEKSRKLIFSNNIGISSNIINKQYYFKPSESVGLGTTTTNRVFISSPGVGATFIDIPARSIYLENHNLQTNAKLSYSAHGNQPISVLINGVTGVLLNTFSSLYVARYNDNLIGLSTTPIGIGSTGSFIGIGTTTSLLSFTNFGDGSYHSFNTQYTSLKGDVIKQDIIVSAASSHNLSLEDNINLSVISGITTHIRLKYSDYNRRITSKEVSIQNVDIDNNILKFNEHSFKTCERVIYTTTSSISGLNNNGIYYVISINKFKLKLATSKYNAENLIEVDLQSGGSGSLSSINPPLRLERNSTIVFDLSDSSLGYVKNGFSYSAFSFDVYYDPELNFSYFNNGKSPQLNLTFSGSIGVNTDARATLKIDEFTPSILYYDLKPLNREVPTVKYEKVIDIIQINYNTLRIEESSLSGNYKIKSFGEDTFVLESRNLIDNKTYLDDDNTLTYTTNSESSSGAIVEIQLTKNNNNNYKLPNITKINSVNGSDANLEVSRVGIGSIKTITLNDIGFDYSSDYTVKPKLNLPKILKSEPLYTIDRVEVISTPVTYYVPPKLVLIDNHNNKPLLDAVFSYNTQQGTVDIIKNTKNIIGTNPYIVPTNNSFGLEISNISFNPTTKDVTVQLNQEFNELSEFPFEVGEGVLIENVIVGENEKGYNSSGYDYTLFTIKNIDPNIGGIGATFGYSMSDILEQNEVLGIYTGQTLKGNAVPEKYLPTFNVSVNQTEFVIGENIHCDGSSGIIVDQNLSNNFIKVLTKDDLKIGSKLTGQTSKTNIIISDIVDFEGYLNVKSTSTVIDGWKRETGFFNNNLQRIHDNDYYQYFSYSLSSDVEYSKWNEVVSDLVHPAGFKKFSDLTVYCESPETEFASTLDVEVTPIVDIEIDLNLNCVDNFDLVRENSFIIDDELASNEIYFNSTLLQDYVESIGNRVISIDDFVLDFSNPPNDIESVALDSFNKNDYYYKRYFISVRDKWYQEKSNLIIVNVLHNNTEVDSNQYAELYTEDSFGYFDATLTNNNCDLQFYPEDFEGSNYYLESLSYGIGKNTLGVSTVNLGNMARIEYSGSIHPVGIATTTIVGISSSILAAKIIVGIAYTNNSHYEVDELNLVHNGSTIRLVNYGELVLSSISSGIGTYYAYYTGNKINIDLIPNVVGTGTQYYLNTITNTISNIVGVGSTAIGQSIIVSSASTTSLGIATEVVRYSNNNSGSYSIVSIDNLTNLTSSVVEFTSLYNKKTNNTVYTSYAENVTNGSLGIISSYVKNDNIIVEFKPNNSDSYSIRAINNILATSQDKTSVGVNTSFVIETDYSQYDARNYGFVDNFEALHNENPIFSKTFNGESVNNVLISENKIRLPNHYFVSGEEVTYEYDSSPIGIGTTFIVGIGITTKLPSKIFIIKVDDLDVKVAASASEALSLPPKPLTITSIGIGSQHKVTSTSQTNRSLVTVDNMIQSPFVSTAQTSFTVKSVGLFDSEISLNSIENFASGDFLKIQNEYVKVLSVGIGSTNVLLVDRAKLGSSLSQYSQNTTITKVKGNYIINNNRIYYDSINSNQSMDGDSSYTFGGRVFNRTGEPGSSNKTYFDNYIFDDITDNFNGSNKVFKLKVDNSEIETHDNRNAVVLINGIFQHPGQEYTITENLGISSISFIGSASSVSYDVNTATIPRGGTIVSFATTQGFGYQPLVSAGGTAVVSLAGSIQSISIGNSGSGYRVGIQTVRVGIQTQNLESTSITYVGVASISNGNIVSVAITNPGVGYTASSANVIFDAPLPYSNIPLISSGVGTGASISIVVGQGSSIIDYELTNTGYGYNSGEELSLMVGIPTTPGPFVPFKLKVDDTFDDQFSSWVIGDLQPLDSFDSFFDGRRRNFQLRISNTPISIQKNPGSTLDLDHTLLIFINDVLQIPGVSYIFNGGSVVRFIESPKATDKSKILFYRGTSQYDVANVDVIEELKIGDNVLINSEDLDYQQSDRLITDILSTETVETYFYNGSGISDDESRTRPITLCRQTEDLIINGQVIGKNRTFYDTLINPTTKLISSVSIGATQIFVENVRAFFDNKKEYQETDTPQKTVQIISQDDNNLKYETLTTVKYDGDYGVISGIKTAPIGIGSTGIVFQLYIPQESPLRIDSYVNGGVSGIKTGYYFSVNNSNLSNGIISLNNNETVVGVGTTFLNNVYRAYSVSIAQTSVPGVGITNVVEVTAKVDRFVSGVGISNYYGNYSWGRLYDYLRIDPKEFLVNNSGLSTAPIVQRAKTIKTDNYYS
jgi:hypothetical protein